MLAERTLKLTLEYDGTEFRGYQAQGRGERTVQSTLAEAIATITQAEPTLYAAGRTDTGVHALGQVVSFVTTAQVPTERMAIALNSLLPPDIAVASVEEAPVDFHARFSAKQRTYLYSVWTRRTRSAVYGRYALHVRRPLELEPMRLAARELIGTHDFSAFAKSGGDPGKSLVRDVRSLSIRRASADVLLFRISANGFLRSMVRNIVGALLETGLGDLPVAAIKEILEERDRTKNPVAPVSPHGLCLLRVDY